MSGLSKPRPGVEIDQDAGCPTLYNLFRQLAGRQGRKVNAIHYEDIR